MRERFAFPASVTLSFDETLPADRDFGGGGHGYFTLRAQRRPAAW
jgi:hypothetical protein